MNKRLRGRYLESDGPTGERAMLSLNRPLKWNVKVFVLLTTTAFGSAYVVTVIIMRF